MVEFFLHGAVPRAARIQRAVQPSTLVGDGESSVSPLSAPAPQFPFNPESKSSLVSTLGNSTLSAVGMAGSAVDLPASMARDVLSLNNPFDQLLTPFSDGNRAGGREVLTTWGVTSPNKETGFVPFEDPAEFAQDVAGFALEMALDPLGWWAGWASKASGASVGAARRLASQGRIRRGFTHLGRGLDAIDPGFKIGRSLRGKYQRHIQPKKWDLLDNQVTPFVKKLLRRAGHIDNTGDPTKLDVNGVPMSVEEVVDAFDVMNEGAYTLWRENPKNKGKKAEDFWGELYKGFNADMTLEDFKKKYPNADTAMQPGDDLPDIESLVFDTFPVSALDDPKFIRELEGIKKALQSKGGLTETQMDRLVGRAADIEFKTQTQMFEEISNLDAWRGMVGDVVNARGIDEDVVGDLVRTRSGMDQLMPGRIEDYAGQLSRFLREVDAPGDNSVDALIRDGEDLLGQYDLDEDLFYGVFSAANDRFSKNQDAIYERLNESIAGSDDFQDVLFQRAWHGSKSDSINKFSTDNIGTGEGAAIHGHGLYYSADMNAADRIRTNTAGVEFKYKGATVPRMLDDAMTEQERVLSELANTIAYNEDFGSAVSTLKSTYSGQSNFLDSVSKQDFEIKKGGALYAADIPEDDVLLDLNKTLGAQPDAVSKALRSVLGDSYDERMTGSQAYDALKQQTGSAKAASELLDEMGVRGAKVIDDYSASPGFGKPEYVVFNGDNVSIDGKFSGVEEAKRFQDTTDNAFRQRPNTGTPMQPGGQSAAKGFKPVNGNVEVPDTYRSQLSRSAHELRNSLDDLKSLVGTDKADMFDESELSALNELSGKLNDEEWLSSLDSESRAVVKEYMGHKALIDFAVQNQGKYVDEMFQKHPELRKTSAIASVNAFMRGGGSKIDTLSKSINPEEWRLAANLQDAARNAPPLKDDFVAVRQNFSDDITEALRGIDVGKTIDVKAPTGVSMSPSYGRAATKEGDTFSWVEFEIPAGTRGFWYNASKRSRIVKEHEFVLPMGTKLEVLDKTVTGKRTDLRVRVVDQSNLVDLNKPLKKGGDLGGRKILDVMDLSKESPAEANMLMTRLKKEHGADRVQRMGDKVAILDDTAVPHSLFQKTPDSKGAKSASPGSPSAVRGAVMFDPISDAATIFAFESADVSTLFHETAHVFHRHLDAISPELARQTELAFGVAKGIRWQDWTVDQKESFAEQFESYLKSGLAPTRELDKTFKAYKDWLTSIYKTVRNSPEAVSPEMREVFDGLMSADVNAQGVMDSYSKSTRAAWMKDDVDTGVNEASKMADDVGGGETLFQPQTTPKDFTSAVNDAYSKLLDRVAPSRHRKQRSRSNRLYSKAADAFTSWLNKYDVKRADRIELDKDLKTFKDQGAISKDAQIVTQLTPTQTLVRRMAAGFGADLHYYGGSGGHNSEGLSIIDKSNRIWVSADQLDGGILGVAGHEMLHLMRNVDPQAFRQLLTNILEKEGGEAVIDAAALTYGRDLAGDPLRIEESLAMLAGKAFKNPEMWREIAQDDSVAPYIQRIFSEVTEKLTRRLTKKESDVLVKELGAFMFGKRGEIDKELGAFMFGKRGEMAGGSSGKKIGQVLSDVRSDEDFVANFTRGANQTAQYAPENNLLSRMAFKVDDAARTVASNTVDILERIGRNLAGAMNYKNLGKTTYYGQSMAKDTVAAREQIQATFTEPIMTIQDLLVHNDMVNKPHIYANLRFAIETDHYKDLPEYLQGPARHLHQVLDDLFTLSREVGNRDSVLNDVIGFMHRQIHPEIRAALHETAHGGKTSFGGDLSVKTPGSRTDMLRGFLRGTRGVDDALSEVGFLEIIRQEPNSPEIAARILREKHLDVDPRIPHRTDSGNYQVIDGNTNEPKNINPDEFWRDYEEVDAVTGEDLRAMTPEQRAAEYGRKRYFESRVPDENGEVSVVELVTSATESSEYIPDRFDVLAKWVKDTGIAQYIEANGGVFRNNSLLDTQSYINGISSNIGVADAMTRLLARMFESGDLNRVVAPLGIRRRGITVDDLFKDPNFAHIDKDVVLKRMEKMSPRLRLHAEADGFDVVKEIGNSVIPPDVFQDLITAGNMSEVPKSLAGLNKLMSGWTTMFKAGVLTHPARYVRDVTSALVALSLRKKLSFRGLNVARDIQFGRPNDLLALMPEIQAFAIRNGLAKSAQEVIDNPIIATHAARAQFASMRGNAANIYNDVDLESIGGLFKPEASVQALTDALPGTHKTAGSMWKDVFSYGVTKKGSRNPLNIEGVPYVFGEKGRAGRIRQRGMQGFEQFGPVEAGNIVGKNADEVPRLAGWIEGIMQGQSIRESFDEINDILLDYRPHTFGPAERTYLKKIFTFYSFFSRETKFLTAELMTNPTGRLGKMIRLQRHADSQPDGETLVPEHIRSQFSMPLSDSADGGKNYLTNLGLMHEDPISTLLPFLNSPQSGVRNILSKSNPLIKGVAEFGLGVSSFQGGPLGGRDLSDMDPSLGRIFTNLGLQDKTPGGRAAPAFGSPTLEFALSNSPVSRLLGTAKSILDTKQLTKHGRKEWYESLFNIGSGFRITTVSPETSQSALRDMINAIARDAGARSFETFHINDSLLNYVRETQGDEAFQKLAAGQALRKIMDKESRIKRAAIKREAASRLQAN